MTRLQRILIIDDDPAHLTSTKGILEADGYEVFTLDRPFGATNVVAELKPDLILLDVNMPALSGEKLASIMRGTARIRQSRLMLHSSNDEDALREAAQQLRLDGYVCKGNPQTLRLRVASVLAR